MSTLTTTDPTQEQTQQTVTQPANNAGPEWLNQFPDELKQDMSLRKFNDVQSLAKSYIHAQKLIGAEKIPVPGKHATEEDWTNVYKKLGLPDSPDKYEVKAPETLSKEFIDAYKKQALEAGVLPRQAQKMIDWYTQTNQAAMQKQQETQAQQINEGINSLKKEWGVAFDKEVNAARVALKEFGDESIVQVLNETGLGNHPAMVKLLNKIGKTLAEDKLGPAGGYSKFVVTPEEAMQKIRGIQGDLSHPYYVKEHPNHAAAVKEVEQLYNALNSG